MTSTSFSSGKGFGRKKIGSMPLVITSSGIEPSRARNFSQVSTVQSRPIDDAASVTL